MDFNAQPIGIYIRIVAIISLLLGLNDAARLLGVQLGSVSPITTMGMTGFVYLAIFALTRLFAAVGLWIKASWGAVLLVGATGIELLLYLLGNPDVQMSAFGFAVRLVLLASILIIFVLGIRLNRAQASD
ncbi:hypothetical protein VW29_12660 [Devosia limi DSM 17137]|uniref:Uncharacterized protein n=1 Tax=Devosia limi DSM 17137 TaxID=1121477 RepID=A0A0F5LNY7_9HYPH|nr:DUF6163 family protein [Devosia limi]KKB84013.1 hypothetical protein VW29_12660 [Devosia limi DSM 17137]SHF99777.1 hypothetical protein SAMN02745223_04105 [Devosia limi DSM 17137]